MSSKSTYMLLDMAEARRASDYLGSSTGKHEDSELRSILAELLTIIHKAPKGCDPWNTLFKTGNRPNEEETQTIGEIFVSDVLRSVRSKISRALRAASVSSDAGDFRSARALWDEVDPYFSRESKEGPKSSAGEKFVAPKTPKKHSSKKTKSKDSSLPSQGKGTANIGDSSPDAEPFVSPASSDNWTVKEAEPLVSEVQDPVIDGSQAPQAFHRTEVGQRSKPGTRQVFQHGDYLKAPFYIGNEECTMLDDKDPANWGYSAGPKGLGMTNSRNAEDRRPVERGDNGTFISTRPVHKTVPVDGLGYSAAIQGSQVSQAAFPVSADPSYSASMAGAPPVSWGQSTQSGAFNSKYGTHPLQANTQVSQIA